MNKYKEKYKNVADNPIIDDFSENAYRVRRNLILFAIISIFYKVSGALIEGEKISILGTNFKIPNGDPQHFIDWFLLIILIYHLIHFLWLTFEHWVYNIKIRVTGDFDNSFYGMISGKQEIPDKRKTNLYKILSSSGIDALDVLGLNHPQHIENLKLEVITKINKVAEEQKLEIDNFAKNDPELKNKLIEEFSTRINNIINIIKDDIFSYSRPSSFSHTIKNNDDLIRQFFTEERGFKDLKMRLEKFDKHWEIYGRTQILRWIIVEYGVPIIIGIFGILFFGIDYC
jgi:hypothetical protein